MPGLARWTALAEQVNMKKRVLCLLGTGFEEIEMVAPMDVLRRAGAEVVLASLEAVTSVAGRCQVVVQADARLEGLDTRSFDVLLIPGGPGVKALRANGRPAQLAREFALAGKLVAAICAGPLVLADAGLLVGRKFTAHFSTRTELPEALAAEKVVRDGKIITSRGAGTALEFGLALVQELFGEAAAAEIAKAIMV
jgi:4-methyl-5(b-hydroxyethyl)-thiazole monophosphate biosynthesis